MGGSLRYSITAALIFLSLVERGFVSAQQCPEGYFDINSSCIQFVSELLNWESAESNCETLGGHLAVFSDCGLYAAVVQRMHAQGISDSSYWLGGTDAFEEGNWLWITGEAVWSGAPFWGTVRDGVFEPAGGENENCLCISAWDRFYFHDGNCTTGYHSICQTDPVHV